MSKSSDPNKRPTFDPELLAIAKYVNSYSIQSIEAYHNARLCLMDALGCAILALQYPACRKLLGPIVPDTQVPLGSRIPGTEFVLDPVLAAFNIGTLIRWLDFNDLWLAAEWGHPSDNLAGILAIADYLSQVATKSRKTPLLMQDVFTAMIKAYEIQGILSLKNSFNQVGLDHVVLVKVATTAVVTHLLGGSEEDIVAALSQVWIDGQSLRTYRHAPNTGSRKSWAAGDASARGVWLALMTLRGEMGYPSALSAKKWGFNDAVLKGKKLIIPKPYESYVIENITFKAAFPAEAHAQTAVECAFQLHPLIKDRFDQIQKIVLYTQESAIRIISKTGPLYNPADRDHCIQYMVAIGLIFGELTAQHFEDKIADDKRIDLLRDKIEVIEDKSFSQDYLDPNKRSIANALQIYFKDGSSTEKITIEYPLGHKERRQEGEPALFKKFKNNISQHFSEIRISAIEECFSDQKQLQKMSVYQFMDLWKVR